MGARDWTRRIQEQGARDAVYGRALSAQTERLLVAYVSRSSPDRRRVYEALFQRYGDRLESYRAADGSNMRNVNGMWEYDLTEAEAHMVEAFMEIYGPAFETARADFLASGRLFREV
jgi:hypothetical protein